MGNLPDNVIPAILTSKQAAVYLGISEGRLRNLRWMNAAPKHISYGKRDVRYRIKDLDIWLAIKAGEYVPEDQPKKRGRKRKYAVVNFFVELNETAKKVIKRTGAIALRLTDDKPIFVKLMNLSMCAVILMALSIILFLSYREGMFNFIHNLHW